MSWWQWGIVYCWSVLAAFGAVCVHEVRAVRRGETPRPGLVLIAALFWPVVAVMVCGYWLGTLFKGSS